MRRRRLSIALASLLGLGALVVAFVGGREATVGLEYRLTHPFAGGTFSDMDNFPRCVLLLESSVGEPPTAEVRIVGRPGSSGEPESRGAISMLGGRTAEHVFETTLDLEDIGSIELAFGDVKKTFEVPPLRFRDPTLPACPEMRHGGTNRALVLLLGRAASLPRESKGLELSGGGRQRSLLLREVPGELLTHCCRAACRMASRRSIRFSVGG
ncbi:hypothetical protein HY251_04940 [bacterium]|nr:hypothetical protein [bacterium]